MTGTELYNLLTSILGNVEMDETYALQLMNTARMYIELRRPWQVLKKVDTSQTISTATTYTTPITIPSDFRRWLKEGSVMAFNSAQNDKEWLMQVPFEDQITYKDTFGYFYTDIGASKLYVMGTPPKTYTLYQFYIADYGDIATGTSWQKFPSTYHPILAFEAAAMERLGTSYDDVNARNANDNARRSDMIYKAMAKWDAELALSSVNSLDYPDRSLYAPRQGRGWDTWPYGEA